MDDFKVVKVTVAIRDNNGETLESGEAVEKGSWKWEYRLKNDYTRDIKLKIFARAWDKPGNIAEIEIDFNPGSTRGRLT